MNYSEIYQLEHSQGWKSATEQISSGIDSFKLKWGIEPPKETIQILYKSKKEPTEFLVCSLLFYLHESLLEKFEKAGITGWKTYPIELIRKGKAKEIIDGYHVLTVYGRCGDRDADRSVVVQKIYPYANNNRLKGVYFTNDEWDGNDFFMFENKGFIFISKKLKDLLIKEKVKYAELIPLTEITFEDKKLKEKVFEEIENGTYKGDYLNYLDVARIYYKSNEDVPKYLDAMNDEDFKKQWDICNTKENYRNIEMIEKHLRRQPDNKEILRAFSYFDSKTRTSRIDLTNRYNNFKEYK